MIPVCDCSDLEFTVQNLGGFKECKGGIGIIKSAIFAAATKVDGTTNGLTLATTAPNAAFFDGKFADPIQANRYARLDDIKQYAAPPVAPNTKTFDDGSIFKLSENGKQVTWVTVSYEANKLKAKLDSIVDCRGDVLVSFNDSFNNWVGESTGTVFQGRLMQAGSYYSQVQEAVDGDVPQLIVTFNWDPSALEGAVQYIPESAMGGYSLKRDVVDLIDGRIVYGSSLLASIGFNITSDVGGVNTLGEVNKLPLGGLDETNLQAWDVGGAADIPGTVTEPTVGNYVFTYTSPILAGVTVRIQPINTATFNYIEKSYDLKDLTLNDAPTVSA
ncbi:MAG: hypothetical protein KAJ19_25610 [Gammaproteobacteria bacterium]|nr:hypothetical protein [Gammaproteobacteria bacterium]